MTIQVTRKLEFDTAHRVMNHESKCSTLHGHRYVAEITAKAEKLDRIGRVIDFSVLKAKIGAWIDENWDHTSIVFKKDEDTLKALLLMPRKKEPFVSNWNPTAENMSDYLLNVVCPKELAGLDITVVKVKLYETPNCWAEAVLENQ